MNRKIKQILIFLQITLASVMLGCTSVPQAVSNAEREAGLLVYRQNVLGGAASTIIFELNDVTHKIGSGGSMFLKPKIGINKLIKTSAVAGLGSGE